MPKYNLGHPPIIKNKKRKAMAHYEYCPICRGVKEHIKDAEAKLCKTCGHVTHRFNAEKLLLG